MAAIDDEPAGIVIQEDIGAGRACNTLLVAKAEKRNCVSSKMTLRDIYKRLVGR
jgi:hypothetical protein